MRYTLEIEDDLLEELNYLAKRLNTNIDSLIIACVKSHIISVDVFNGSLVTKEDSRLQELHPTDFTQ